MQVPHGGLLQQGEVQREGYNLACILTLPPLPAQGLRQVPHRHQLRAAKKEGKVGTPERPLSDLGNVRPLFTVDCGPPASTLRNAAPASLLADFVCIAWAHTDPACIETGQASVQR